MRSKLSQRRRLAYVSTAIAAVMTAAGCTTGPAGGDSSGTSAADDAVAEQARKAIEALYGAGTYREPASEGPAAQPGYKVALVNSGVQSPSGTKQAVAAGEAAALLGWELSVYDGQYDPAEYQEGIRQAIAQDADAIWLWGIDCPLVQTALQEAQRAEIPVVSQESADCSDGDPAAETYFARTLPFSEGTFIDWGRAMGEAQAVWLLAQLGEEANILEVSVPELVVTQAIHDGFNATMEERCPSCEVTTLEVGYADFGPMLQEKVATALLRGPDINGLALSYEDLVTAGGSAAVMESGRNDSLFVTSGASFAANSDLIRSNGGQDSGYVFDTIYETWASADMINRMFAGEEAVQTGVGIAFIDRDNTLPPEGEDWQTEIDFRSVYKEVWGVS